MTGRCLHRLPFLEGGGQTGVRVSVEQLTSPECSISLSHVLEDALGFVLIVSESGYLVGSPHAFVRKLTSFSEKGTLPWAAPLGPSCFL